MRIDAADNQKVQSPFDPELRAVLTNTIPSSLIVDIYRKFGLDVERFFESISRVGIYECPLTKYRFYHPYSIMADDEFYEDVRKLKLDYYVTEKREFDIALAKLSEGDRVLEVGCGNGVFLKKLRDKRIDGVGLEFNDRAVEECRESGLDVQRLSIEDFAAKNIEKFDAVVLFQVLEHVYDVEAFITSLLACLKKGGKLIFAVPDNSPFYKNFRIYLTMNLPPHHMGLWNAESFKNLEKVFPISLTSVEYDDDYSSILKYVYFYGDLLVTKFEGLYANAPLRHLFIVLLIPYTLPVVLKMKLFSELKPHSIIATFVKSL